jgi:hypothetical protein
MANRCLRWKGADELSPGDVSRLLVTCSTEVILHMIGLMAEFDPAKARAIWLGLSSDAVRRLEDLCRKPVTMATH